MLDFKRALMLDVDLNDWRPGDPVPMAPLPPEGECPKCDGVDAHAQRCPFARALLRGSGGNAARRRPRHGRPRGRQT